VSDFKGRHFEGEIVLWAVRWYCRYGVSYRDLEQMMGERGVSVDHSTIFRWVQKYAPEIEKRLRWQWRRPRSTSWRIDETYVKVRGRWAYLYRAVALLHGLAVWAHWVRPVFRVIRCGRTPGARGPTSGSERWWRWLPRLPVAGPFANGAHHR
jgi:DDE domain